MTLDNALPQHLRNARRRDKGATESEMELFADTESKVDMLAQHSTTR